MISSFFHQFHRNEDAERKCLENLVLHFGRTRTDAWIRYLQFERCAKQKNVKKVHDAALATLKAELLDEFWTFYNSFQHGNI